VGKILGPGGTVLGGVGSAAEPWGEHRVGALAVVNALGDVIGADGEILAGARSPGGGFLGTDSFLLGGGGPGEGSGAAWGEGADDLEGPASGVNTTLLVVGTDVPLSRVDLGRLARLASGAFSRAISPVNTPFDGDVLFALSSGERREDLRPDRLMSLGVMARNVAERAIRRAVSPDFRAGAGEGGRGS